ncbi:MAG TPA: hypothetical protein VHC00_03810 [Rhizobiaceae bacterium]|nr:hypothetical protein [Rhizobiaceae bacterium]
MDDLQGLLAEESSAHSYFVPIVDMLAGVVFLLIIMLAASVLVSRPEFGQTEQMQAEIARISRELQDAKAKETRYIEPRRQARMAMGVLLGRLSSALDKAGFSANANPDEGTLSIGGGDIFDPSGKVLGDKGMALARTLAGVLSGELPCLARTPAGGPAACGPYGGARLDSAMITVPANGAHSARAEALRLLSAVASAAPGLLALEAPDGATLLGYGLGGPPSPASSSSAGQASAPVTLRFQMDVPAIP